ncbi:MAG: DNA repair protein RecO [Paracoccaceae bacterium]
MEWRDEGVILSMRPHGESAAIIEVFTRDHGRHAGVVRGGTSRRMAAHVQPGTQVAVVWTARLAEHIGAYTVEPVRSRAHVLSDRLALAGLSSACALSLMALPEREPIGPLWQATVAVLDALAVPDWPAAYLRWELVLLQELGFGLDLASCAVTGARDGLSFVSPKTGRAVSLAAAGDWADRLLPMPRGLAGTGPLTPDAVLQGLAITAHFLTREMANLHPDRRFPEARGRLVDLLTRQASAP